jgi:hypothetical protein
MIWQDYRKLYMNALVQYSPKFKKELQKQVDTYCRTQDLNAISDLSLKKTIKRLHVAMGTKMALIAEKDVKKATKGAYVPLEVKSKKSDLFSLVILQYLETRGLDKLAADITDTTKDQIRRFILKGQEENLTMPQIIASLKIDNITDYRAELIARTETARAANIGSMVGAISTGLVTVKEWISAQDHRTRREPKDTTDHYNMNGVKINMEAKFEVPNNKVGLGYELMDHPGDSTASAANVCNCRCTLGYEAIRDEKGKLKTYKDNPPMGQIGVIWNLLNSVDVLDVSKLIAEALL